MSRWQKFIKISSKILPRFLWNSFQIANSYRWTIDRKRSRRSSWIERTSNNQRPRHGQHLGSSRYKTVSRSFRSSVLRSFLSASEYDVERRGKDGGRGSSMRGEKRKKKERKEEAARRRWKRDYGRIIGFASYGSLLEKVRAKLSSRHVAATSSKSAANFYFNKTLLPKSSNPSVSLSIYSLSLSPSSFFSSRPRYIFIAFIRLSAFSTQSLATGLVQGESFISFFLLWLELRVAGVTL